MLNILCDVIHDVVDKHCSLTIDRVIRQFRKRLAPVIAAKGEQHFD